MKETGIFSEPVIYFNKPGDNDGTANKNQRGLAEEIARDVVSSLFPGTNQEVLSSETVGQDIFVTIRDGSQERTVRVDGQHLKDLT